MINSFNTVHGILQHHTALISPERLHYVIVKIVIETEINVVTYDAFICLKNFQGYKGWGIGNKGSLMLSCLTYLPTSLIME